MKKGFTLIELLAVIVILAIIALIATPMILGVIDSAKKGAAESSTYGYIDAIEKSDLKNMIDTGDYQTKKDGTYDLSTLIDVVYKGTAPTAVCVVIKDGSVESGEFKFDNYIVDYQNGKAKVNNEKTEVSCNPPTPKIVFDEEKGVNIPQLSEGMTPIKWDSSNNEIETTADDPDWYDYSIQKWANVKTKDGSYFVWIPRYAYKITSGYHLSATGAIDIKFLKGISDTTVDGTSIETSGYIVGTKDTSMHYFTHPAFQNDINQLGYWVAKFEPTAVEGVANGYTSDYSCPSTADNEITKTIKVEPNVQSWRCITVANAYNTSLKMKDKKEIYGWNQAEVDTHIMTNLEWGAVAYLTISKYGTNRAEVYINNSQTYTTGCAGASVSASAYNGCYYKYNTVGGVKASTTYNITGIYDMRGSAPEMLMGVYNELPASSGFTIEELSNLSKNHITKYVTEAGDLLNGVGMNYDLNVYGDAMYETSNNAYRYNGSTWVGNQLSGWFGDQTNLTYGAMPWFVYGGSFVMHANSGLYSFVRQTGGINGLVSFRPIVSVIK